MIRVAVDANALAWGWSGIPKYIDRIVRELAKRDDLRVELLANTRSEFTSIDGVRQVFARRKGGTLWRNTFVLPWLARERPDVFWAPEVATPLSVPVPYVVTVHDVASAFLSGIKPWRHALAYRLTLPRAVRGATRVIAVSNTTARDVERLWRVASERVRVIPNGVDAEFTPGDREAARARVRSRWNVGSAYVLFVGTLEPRKGVALLAETALESRRRGADRTFVAAGSSGYRGEELVARARDEGALVVLGSVSGTELVDLYRAADVLVAPSLYEGFGLPPLEAMACGTPAVVAADAGALAEVAGEAAVSVSSRTPDAWLDAIDEAVLRRDELAQAGLRHAARFRWPEVADAVAAVLVDAASAAAGGGGTAARRGSSSTGTRTA